MRIAHSAIVTPFLTASSFTSRSRVTSRIRARAAMCSERRTRSSPNLSRFFHVFKMDKRCTCTDKTRARTRSGSSSITNFSTSSFRPFAGPLPGGKGGNVFAPRLRRCAVLSRSRLRLRSRSPPPTLRALAGCAGAHAVIASRSAHVRAQTREAVRRLARGASRIARERDGHGGVDR